MPLSTIKKVVKDSKSFIISVLLLLVISSLVFIPAKNKKPKHTDIKTVESDVVVVAQDAKSEKAQQPKKDAQPKQEPKEKPYRIERKILANPKTKGLSQDVLHLALKAYYNADEEDEIDNNKLTIIDYSKPSNERRMWVINMDTLKVEYNTQVSHGARSGGKYTKEFSNLSGSHKSSVGVMKTGSIYYGKAGMSLHLHGLEKNINDNVYNRHVVIHGADYVSEYRAQANGQIGRSFGCPAVSRQIAKPLIKKIANGSLVFVYYPLKSWLAKSEYL